MIIEKSNLRILLSYLCEPGVVEFLMKRSEVDVAKANLSISSAMTIDVLATKNITKTKTYNRN